VGYEYIATESATAHARWISEPPLRGNNAAILRLAKRYPFAMTFRSDAEAQMFAEAGRISRGKGRPVWGIDQEFGAEAALERIVRSAPTPEARAYANDLLKRAHEAEADREKLNDETHFIARLVSPEELTRLAELYSASKNTEIRWLIQDLRDSNKIYWLYHHGSGNQNSTVREDYMKRVFMDEYRRAERLDRRMPKVVFKAGHWHALRGSNPNFVFTTGNMLSEFAKANGSRAFVVSTYRYEPGNYMSKAEDMRLLAEVADPSGIVVIDFEGLRDKLFARRFRENLPPSFFQLIFKADAAMIMGGEKSSGTTEIDAAK
jgi:hypothetical protein